MSNYFIIFIAFLWRQLRYIIRNPMVVFVYGILSKWYIMIFVTSIIITFFVFKGLEESGVLESAETIVSKAFTETKSVAKYCVPQIKSLEKFWNCLQHPPEYKPSAKERQHEEDLKQGLEGISKGVRNFINSKDSNNDNDASYDPYADEEYQKSPKPSAPPSPG